MVDVHWPNFGAKISQFKLVCPLSAAQQECDDLAESPLNKGDLIGTKKKHAKCKACAAGVQRKDRYLSVGWDVSSGRWCVFMAAQRVFGDAFTKSKALGIRPSDMARGNGLDVIIQRVGINSSVEVIPESLGKRPPSMPDEIPDTKLVISGLGKKSLWRLYSTPDEIPKDEEYGANSVFMAKTGLPPPIKTNSTIPPILPDIASSHGGFMDIPPDIASSHGFMDFMKKTVEKPEKQDPKPIPPREWIDGSSMITKNRWEMM
jgi:hypothetical protein